MFPTDCGKCQRRLRVPVSAAGFAMAGLAVLENGIVVLNVQLAWLLPDDHDESGLAPFLCGHCLLAQSLLMFPPTIFFSIVLVPLLLVRIAGVDWYFQKFTSFRLTQPGRDEYQRPLSRKRVTQALLSNRIAGCFKRR